MVLGGLIVGTRFCILGVWSVICFVLEQLTGVVVGER